MKELLFVFLAYLKKFLKYLLLFLFFAVIFNVVFFLYGLPVYAVWYASFLCIVSGVLFFVFDFYAYQKRHDAVLNQRHSITLGTRGLPEASELIERDYQLLLETLFDFFAQRELKSENAKKEMLDYYTLWAHQIKTPIAAMSLLLQTEQCNSAQMAMELFKTEKYVGMVLQYLKIESLSSDLVLKEYSLEEIVKTAVREYSVFFIHKKISLSMEIGDVTVLTDKKWLLFVLEQILSNALKYTNRGKISVYMDVSNKKTLVIEDTGIGISQEDISRIFERGFTGLNGRMNQKSTGIGLYLCKQICSKLSHTITASSVVGKGTKIMLSVSRASTFIE